MKLDKSYQPSEFEEDIYKLWEQKSAFMPNHNGPAYSVVVPPPNANGNLHLGHALSFALQDIAVRYHRSKGESVLYIPGADHAGFETQVVFERQLEKEGKSRFLYSREQLYDLIYKFVADNRLNFESQIRRLGASVDWSHYTFSLDEPIIQQTYATFKAMLNDGLVYRGERLVNFCTFHGTAFADIEVDYQDEEGFLWQINYPLVDGSGSITVATTRPETLFGDTAIAVNPKDDRYKSMIGKTLRLPLTDREIPVIADDYVDMNFGTGALKITPAHDPNDFDTGKRHDLPSVTVIGFDGLLNHNVPKAFQNLNIDEGREVVINSLRKEGLLVNAEPYTHSVGHCYKCGTIIEPLLKEQWFINTKPLAEAAIKALSDDKIDFYPLAKKEQLITYLKNIRDWNISRQISWGIPIPAFRNEEDPDDWIFNEHVEEETIVLNNKRYVRDPDVFDTWFSSSSWPYSTLNFPDNVDFKQFYPLSLMETGVDILMPWVSRMLMLGIYVTGGIPFKTVYLHGLILDPSGKKMSKSKGNVVDPISVIDQYGSDALRMGIISGQTPGNNQPYVESKIIGGRNFCNKLWNISRFIEEKISTIDKDQLEKVELIEDVDHWIVKRYMDTLNTTTSLMDQYRFSEAFEIIYHYIWDDLADWYIEVSKNQLNPGLLLSLLKSSLILIHPFAPFLSEAIWQKLELDGDSLLSSQKHITYSSSNNDCYKTFDSIRQLIISIRSTLKAVGNKKIDLYYQEDPTIAKYADIIKQLAGLKIVEKTQEGQGVMVANTTYTCWLDISQDQIDSYVKSLDEKISTEQESIKRLQGRLNNQSYLKQAPKDLVDSSRDQLVEAEHNLENYLLERLRFKHD